jgi:hypothetical protein
MATWGTCSISSARTEGSAKVKSQFEPHIFPPFSFFSTLINVNELPLIAGEIFPSPFFYE